MTILSWFEDYGENNIPDFDLSELKRDEAYLQLSSSAWDKFLYTKHKDCVDCYYSAWHPANVGKTILKKVPQILYRLSTKDTDVILPNDTHICEFGSDFNEFGIYQLNVNDKNECEINVIKEGVSIAFPALTVLLIYLGFFAFIFGAFTVWKKCIRNIQPFKPKNDVAGKPRVQSLDTFRGISIVLMIFVNYGAGGYEILDHAPWNGLHAADLVFPWFLWIMGACIPISLTSSFRRGASNGDIFLNVLKRAIKLFCLGIFLGGGSRLQCLRIFGVLQRFGISYLVVTTICLFLIKRESPKIMSKWGKMFEDILKLATAWVVILVILLIHCLITFLVAEKGCLKGYLGPGGEHKFREYEHCTGGAAGYIDKVILGDHRYKYPTIGEVFNTGAFDPEGILGCLTSIVHAFIGVQAGMILIVYKEHSARLMRWLAWGLITGLIGGALCGFSKEDGLIPVNKNLWSLSFVLVTCCFAFVLLSFCYVLIDVKRWWSGKPFLFAGMNAILMYIGHTICDGHFPMNWTVNCDGGPSTHFFAFFEHTWGAGFWVLVSYYLFKINYFFTI